MKENDLRVLRTEKMIRNAFWKLMEKHDYRDITVQQILDKACINRSTFYKHYQNKNDLAQDIIKDYRDNYIIPALDQRLSMSALDFVNNIKPSIMSLRNDFKILFRMNTNRINIYEMLSQLFEERYYQKKSQDLTFSKGKTPEELEFCAKLFSKIAMCFVEYLIIDGQKVSDERMLEITSDCMKNFLE